MADFMEKTTFADRLSTLQKDFNLSNGDLAGLMSATKEGLRKWQIGKVLPNVKYLFALVENFTTPDGREISVEWLFTGDGERYIYKGVEKDSNVGMAEQPAEREIAQVPVMTADPARLVGDAVNQLTNILTSNDKVLTRAILANLQAFSQSVDSHRYDQGRIAKLEAECAEMKEENSALEKRMSALEEKLWENNPGEDPAEEPDEAPGERKVA